VVENVPLGEPAHFKESPEDSKVVPPEKREQRT